MREDVRARLEAGSRQTRGSAANRGWTEHSPHGRYLIVHMGAPQSQTAKVNNSLAGGVSKGAED